MQVSLGGRLFCNDCSAYNCFAMARERSPHAETGGECRNHEKVAGQALLTEFCVAKLANVLFSRVFTYSQTDVSFYG